MDGPWRRDMPVLRNLSVLYRFDYHQVQYLPLIIKMDRHDHSHLLYRGSRLEWRTWP